MIFRYNDFLDDKVESVINESVLYYSPELVKVLDKIFVSSKEGDIQNISKDIILAEVTDIKPDITFVTLDKDGYLSFTTQRNAENIIDKSYPDIKSKLFGDDITTHRIPLKNLAYDIFNNSEISLKSRSQLKIGKFINRLFPGKYTPKQIEDFTNEFKSVCDTTSDKIQIVEGDDIAYWYNKDNYYDIDGSLGNSCMKSMKSDVFRIYTKNPEVCRLLIITENNKLKARALVWKVTSRNKEDLPYEYVLDRQYTLNDSLVNKMKAYADSQGWAYKSKNSFSSYNDVTFKDESHRTYLQVKLGKYVDDNSKIGSSTNADYDYEKYPYMDTFRTYDVKKGILRNECDSDVEGDYDLSDTSGGYTEIGRNVYSDYYDCEINVDDAVYSDYLSDYIYSDSAIYIQGGSRGYRGYLPEDYSSVVTDYYTHNYYHEDDCVYSDVNDGYVLQEDAVEVITRVFQDRFESDWYSSHESIFMNVSSLEELYWFRYLVDNIYNFEDCKHILKNILEIDVQGNLVPERMTYKVFELIKPMGEIKYLTEVDAHILDKRINKYHTYSIDKIAYDNLLNKHKLVTLIIKGGEKILSDIQLSLDVDDAATRDLIKDRKYKIGIRLDQLDDKSLFFD